MIEVQNIKKSFRHINVLKGVDIQINKGEIVTIYGASGAGKTTLLQIMGTLDKPEEGKVLINGVKLMQLKENKLADFRNKNIGFVFQFHHLLPEFSAFENVCIPGYISGKSKKHIHKRAKELLDFLNMGDRLEHKPAQLSGGEQQRVAVARALINTPSVILADEPSGNLDSKNKEELHKLFRNLKEEFQQTIVIATHDTRLTDIADRTINMKDGILWKNN